MENRKINILGTEYRVEFRKEEEDAALKECNGYCDVTVKLIVVLAEPNKECDYGDFSALQRKTLRHEIIHAFLTESGLFNNTYNVDSGWAKNEEMVDWFAIQSPKIFKVYSELGILDASIPSIPPLQSGKFTPRSMLLGNNGIELVGKSAENASKGLDNLTKGLNNLGKALRNVSQSV